MINLVKSITVSLKCLKTDFLDSGKSSRIDFYAYFLVFYWGKFVFDTWYMMQFLLGHWQNSCCFSYYIVGFCYLKFWGLGLYIILWEKLYRTLKSCWREREVRFSSRRLPSFFLLSNTQQMFLTCSNSERSRKAFLVLSNRGR